MSEFVSVGFCKKPHGLKGDVKIQIEEEYLDDFLQCEVVFLEIGGKQLPHFIENIRPGNDLLVKFEDVDSPEVAVAIAGKEVFMRVQDVSVTEDDDLTYDDLVGFKIIDENLGEIGEIEEIAELPEQFLAILTYQNKEVLIPLVEDFILDINTDNQVITMDLPKGLLEL